MWLQCLHSHYRNVWAAKVLRLLHFWNHLSTFLYVWMKKKKKDTWLLTLMCWRFWKHFWDFHLTAALKKRSSSQSALNCSGNLRSASRHTNAEASCDLAVNLFTVSTKTCQGKRSRFSVVTLLDVAQIACTINVHKASVMRSLWTPEGWSAADCVVQKRGGALHVVTVMFPLRVIRLSLRCKMSFKYIHVFLPAPLSGWWSRWMSSYGGRTCTHWLHWKEK